MTTDTTIAEALPACFPLPRTISIGDQRWRITVSVVIASHEEGVSVRLLLSGPYERHRRARLDLDEGRLLAKGYDPARAVGAITAWLPNSDEDDVFELSGRDLALPSSPHVERPAAS